MGKAKSNLWQKEQGPTGIWTRIDGFKVHSDNHYTIGPNGWRIRVSIPVPHACKARTLPIELIPHVYVRRIIIWTRSKNDFSSIHIKGRLAQLVEHWSNKPRVAGSSPVVTILFFRWFCFVKYTLFWSHCWVWERIFQNRNLTASSVNKKGYTYKQNQKRCAIRESNSGHLVGNEVS